MCSYDAWIGRRLLPEVAPARLKAEELSLCYDSHDVEVLSAHSHLLEAVAKIKK